MIEHAEHGFRFCYGGLELPFQVETKKRKNLSITVLPDRTLQVVAPENADLKMVLERVDSRAAWIAKQWRAFGGQNGEGEGPGYFAGETHWYLGRAYRLKIRPLQVGERESVVLEGRFLWIVVPMPTDTKHVEQMLNAWYRQKAREIFALWLVKCLARSRSLNIETAPQIEIRQMQKRWGSCTRTGKIILNLDLVKAPVDSIEYVITHELCHMEAAHHGPDFYRLLSRFLPDWMERKQRLEEFGGRL